MFGKVCTVIFFPAMLLRVFPNIWVKTWYNLVPVLSEYITLIFVEILQLHYTLQRINIHRYVCKIVDKAMFRPSIDHSYFSLRSTKNIHAFYSVLKLWKLLFLENSLQKFMILKCDNGRRYLSELFISLFPFTK